MKQIDNDEIKKVIFLYNKNSVYKILLNDGKIIEIGEYRSIKLTQTYTV